MFRPYRVCYRNSPVASGGSALRSGNESLRKPTANQAKVHHKDRDMGAALRTVYQKTVDEEIPADLLDLLGKLD